ncbi:OPT oligopeptide transporter protein-domain-containing protein [Lipomyces kononenkoae]|uniref:OPT oligopeptide transporter protein-domain-containing protein n=1 Tax=Lipomyces kononenkoae TaxID=34357 RepID=A0ACC3SSI1_LIPKO
MQSEKITSEPVISSTDSIPSEKDGIDVYAIDDLRERFGYRFSDEAATDKLHAGSADLDFVFDKIHEMTFEKAFALLQEAALTHTDDPNFPSETMIKIKDLLDGEKSVSDRDAYEFDVRAEATLIYYFSPYPEVRSITDPHDDSTAPVETFRAYFLAVIWTIICTGVNQFFTTRMPAITISAAVVQVLLYPCGKAMQLLPNWGFTFRGQRYSLNPCPWSYKEQMFVTIMVNVTVGGSYFTKYIILTQKLPMFYNQNWANYGYQFLLAFSTQLFGFGFAGVLRRWVIYPTKAIWPSVLPTIALNRALLAPEKKQMINGWSMSRYRFFFIVFVAMFIYFWIPDYLFNALSTFNWLTWIAPKNFVLAVITGSSLGLGLNPIPTFDWNVINNSVPLATPFYATLNIDVGMLISFFVILGVNWTNFYWSGYIPINTNLIVDNRGASYNVTRVLTNNLLDVKKYHSYSPPYWSAGNLVVYGAYLANYPLAIVYVLMNEWKPILGSFRDFWQGIRHRGKNAYEQFTDPLSQMMLKYKEVPDWWFLIIVLISFVLGIVGIEIYPTYLAWWGFVVIILLNAVFLIPICLIRATTGFNLGLNVLGEVLAGYMFPGNGTANMILKTFGYNIDGQAESFVGDLKMAHYSKIPPRAVFRGQLIATIIQVIVSIGVANWQIGNTPNICAANNVDKFTCPGLKTIYSASVMWGVISPSRLFGLYPILPYCFLIGAVIAVLFWLAQKKFPKLLANCNPVLIVGGFCNWAPYNLTYHTSGFYVAIFFMYYVKRRYLAWWEKYVYLLSASMTAGVAFSAVIIFFAVQYYPKPVNWWGNTVAYAGTDHGHGRQTLLPLPEQGYFGVPYGQFP